METQIYQSNQLNIKTCARLLREGEIVAFPTETVYGLGANAFLPDSVKKIYEAKGRPSDNPLIVHIADKTWVDVVADFVPDGAKKVIEKFMPGPVTVVLKKKKIVPDSVTGGLDTVAVRMPNSKVALDLILEAGVPVCAPSANTSSKPSPTKASHVYDDLNGKISAILDGGECEVGVESTVIDFTGEKPRLLRAGGMALEKIEEVVGEIEVVRSSTVALCPGMKYKHYSPSSEVFVATADENAVGRMVAFYEKCVSEGKKAVVIAMEENARDFDQNHFYSAGKSYEDYARKLFSLLRQSDDDGYDIVIAQGVEEKGIGSSIANRLEKACGGKFI
ncbi:MAG: threonylcarbamoyl-AMP synthase [Clostridia bacterium]|nr:threonylcarbamoyl-AMP synthase [Clostridia bacterium]